MEVLIERVEKPEEASVTGERRCGGWKASLPYGRGNSPGCPSATMTGAEVEVSGGEGGRGRFTGSASSGKIVTFGDATDAGRVMFCGETGVGGTVDAEVEVVAELMTEQNEGIGRICEPRCHLTSGALTRTGVRRIRRSESARVIVGDFARSGFVTMSAVAV